jgi:hypothetical protein
MPAPAARLDRKPRGKHPVAEELALALEHLTAVVRIDELEPGRGERAENLDPREPEGRVEGILRRPGRRGSHPAVARNQVGVEGEKGFLAGVYISSLYERM